VSEPSNKLKYEFNQRIGKLQKSLQEQNLDGALFFQSEDIFYFTGTGVNSVLVVPSNQEPILLVRINVEKGRMDSLISDVRPSNGLTTLVDVVNQVLGEKKLALGISFDVINLSFYHQLQRQFSNAVFCDIQPIVWCLRLIKSDWEIAQIKAAAEISYKGIEGAIGILKEGISEIKFQKSIEQIKVFYGDEGNMIQRGSNNRLPFGVVAFGKNTSIISGNWMTMTSMGRSPSRPYGAGNDQLEKGDLVVIDHGTVYQGYHSDEARTFIYGKADKRHKYLHSVVNELLEMAISEIRPGVSISEVYLQVEKLADRYGIKDQFMGLEQYGFRYIGHGIGLEIDEPPLVSAFNKKVLEPGMVLAIEPKLIFKNEFGITQEDTIVVTESGCEVITSFPHDRFEV